MDIANAIIICCIILLAVTIVRRVQSRHGVSHDYMTWQLSDQYANDKEAAHLMSRCHERMMKLMRHLKRKYEVDFNGNIRATAVHDEWSGRTISVSQLKKDCLRQLFTKYNPDNFYENDPRKIGKETSYTVGKGAAMYICLRSKSNPERLVGINSLMFVLIHEASHIANTSWGHDEQYWMVFKWMLAEATECKIYEVEDYARDPVNYCGLIVDYQPLLDNGRPMI